MKKLVCFIFLFVTGLNFAAVAQPPEIETLHTQASSGNTSAQTKLGCLYFWGDGVPKDYPSAIKWFQLAAKRNDPEAECMLGFCYYFGHGVSTDCNEAIKWWEKSAAHGFVDARQALQLVKPKSAG